MKRQTHRARHRVDSQLVGNDLVEVWCPRIMRIRFAMSSFFIDNLDVGDLLRNVLTQYTPGTNRAVPAI
jgi:hypothetical protein